MSRFLSFLSLPENRSAFEMSLWVLRALGALTFLAWPAVVAADIMGLAAPPSSEPLKLQGQLFHIFMWVSLIYPLIFIAIWIIANSIKSTFPLAALLLTALPAVGVYGTMGYSYVRGRIGLHQTKKQNQDLTDKIYRDLDAGNYHAAFAPFHDPSMSDDVYSAENYGDLALSKKIEEIPRDKMNSALIEEMLRFAQPSLNGVLSVHRSYDSGKRLIFESELMMQLLARWRTEGLKPSGLSAEALWWWNRIEFFVDARQARELLPKAIHAENNFLADLAEDGSEQFDNWTEKHGAIDPRDLNRKGANFGTPLYACLMEFGLSGQQGIQKKIRFLLQQGARLDAAEENPASLALLEKAKSENSNP